MPSKADMRRPDGWTDKERLFAHEYLIDKCKKEAAIRAGYSAKTAVKIGSEVYNRPHVKAWIEERLEQKCEELDITVERVLKEVAALAFIDLKTELKAALKPDEFAAAETLLSTMRVSDKKGALELLGKYLKMWTDKVEVNERPKVFVRDLTGKKD